MICHDYSQREFLRSARFRLMGGIVCLVVTLIAFSCSKKEAAKTELAYPAPRFPRYLAHPGKEGLMKAARFAVRQSMGMSPLGKIESGKTVYVLIQWGQDMDVWEAVKQAWKERGVDARLMYMWDVMGLSKEEYEAKVKPGLMHGNEGWKEIGNFEPVYRQFLSKETQAEFALEPLGDGYIRKNHLLNPYLEKHPEIQQFFAGLGGGTFWKRALGPKLEDRFKGNWLYIRPGDLMSKAAEYPPDVWNLVEEKILRPISFVSEVTFDDPEGTHLHWMVTPEEAIYWTKSTGASNHLYIYPNPLHSTLQEGAVVRGTANDMGVYPVMTAHLDQHGRLEKLEGGGKTGDLVRMLLENPTLKNAKFPKAPESGYWFLRQDGFATNPKYVRSMPTLTEGDPWVSNGAERQRAGVQHLSYSYQLAGPEDEEYAKTLGLNDMIWGHTDHTHNFFATAKWKLRDTGEWLTITDKGYLKTLDDPEVRALASRYGDPALVFRYEWIPSVPGINVPGNYEKDFAPDPWTWMTAEWKQIQDATYQYFVEDYSLNKQEAQSAGHP